MDAFHGHVFYYPQRGRRNSTKMLVPVGLVMLTIKHFRERDPLKRLPNLKGS